MFEDFGNPGWEEVAEGGLHFRKSHELQANPFPNASDKDRRSSGDVRPREGTAAAKESAGFFAVCHLAK